MDNWTNRHKGMLCSTCRFYVVKEAEKKNAKEVGRCRRHAPVVGEGYPVVFPNDWCGDHKLDENKI
jgi:hypothetical protein